MKKNEFCIGWLSFIIDLIVVFIGYNLKIEVSRMATQSQANFAQPPSLVKYSNPVLVSTAGKKQNKVFSS